MSFSIILPSLNFTPANFFPSVEFGSLKEVSGGFNLQSTDGKFNCDTFDKMKNDIIHGKYNCDAKKDNPTTSNGKSGTSSSSSSSSGSSGTSSGAAVVNSGSVSAAGIATVFYAIAQLF